jgi:hypothetical protein
VPDAAAAPSREEEGSGWITGTDPLRGWDLVFPAIVCGPSVRDWIRLWLSTCWYSLR